MFVIEIMIEPLHTIKIPDGGSYRSSLTFKHHGMNKVIEDWETPFITDVFVIPKDQSCKNYDKSLYTQRNLISGYSDDLF